LAHYKIANGSERDKGTTSMMPFNPLATARGPLPAELMSLQNFAEFQAGAMKLRLRRSGRAAEKLRDLFVFKSGEIEEHKHGAASFG